MKPQPTLTLTQGHEANTMKMERDTTLESASGTQKYLTKNFNGKEEIDKDDLTLLVVKLVKKVDHLTNRCGELDY